MPYKNHQILANNFAVHDEPFEVAQVMNPCSPAVENNSSTTTDNQGESSRRSQEDAPHPNMSFPFLDSLCRVCKSPSTGVHYGVATCEGCKGFFKRSIPKSQHYKCYFGGDCEITRETRNRCKACRFQRCVKVGMALEAVKMGRIPKGEKERAMRLLESQAGGSSDDRPVLCPKTLVPALPVLSASSSTISTSSTPISNKPTPMSPGVPSSSLSCSSSSPAVQSSQMHFSPSHQKRFSRQNDNFEKDNPAKIPRFMDGIIKTEVIDPINHFGGGLCVEALGNYGLHSVPKTFQPQPASPENFWRPPENPNRSLNRVHSYPNDALNVQQKSLRKIDSFPDTSNGIAGNYLNSHHIFSALDEISLPDICSPTRTFTSDFNGHISHDITRLNRAISHSPTTFSTISGATSSHRITESLADSGFESRPESTLTSCTFDFDDQSSISDLISIASHQTSFSSTAASTKKSSVLLNNQPFIKVEDPVSASLWETPVAVKAGFLHTFAVARADERCGLMEDVISKIDAAGNDVYQTETAECVEFMVRMWQEGRLSAEERVNDPTITATVVRDHIKIALESVVNSIMQFSSRLPGLDEIDKEDFRQLLELCIFEIWMVQYAGFLVNNESYIMLRSSTVPIHYSRHWMSQFLPEIMISSMMKFADEINPCQMSFLELNILKAMIIACPSRKKLKNADPVKGVRRVYEEALYSVFRRRGNHVADEMMAKVVSLLPKLAALDELHKKCIQPIDMDKESDWKVPDPDVT